MNDESLHPWIEPELEARIVALVLGEASDFEREELERLMGEKPELVLFRTRMDSLHGMLRGLGKGEEWNSEEDWKLPAEQRKTVLDVIDGTGTDGGNKGKVESKNAPVPFRRRVRPWLQWAALIAILACIAGMMFPALQSPMQREFFDYDAASDEYATEMPAVAATNDNSMLVAIDEEVMELDSLQRLGRVDIEGNERTRDQVTRREIPLLAKKAAEASPVKPDPSDNSDSLSAAVQIGQGGYSADGIVSAGPSESVIDSSSDGAISVSAGGNITLFDSQKNTASTKSALPHPEPTSEVLSRSEFLTKVDEEWELKEKAPEPRSTSRFAMIGNGGRGGEGGTDRAAGQRLTEVDRTFSAGGTVSDVEDKVPLQGDLPAIGQAFRSDSGRSLDFPAAPQVGKPVGGNTQWFGNAKAKKASGNATFGSFAESDFADAYVNPSVGDNRQLREKQHGGVADIALIQRPAIDSDKNTEAMTELFAVVPEVVGSGRQSGRQRGEQKNPVKTDGDSAVAYFSTDGDMIEAKELRPSGEVSLGAKGRESTGGIRFPSTDDMGVKSEFLRLGEDEAASSDDLFERNFAGGANTLRGFDYRRVGTSGAETTSTPDYQIDLKTQPEVITFDGFVNYGVEITSTGEKEERLSKSERKELPVHPATTHLTPAVLRDRGSLESWSRPRLFLRGSRV